MTFLALILCSPLFLHAAQVSEFHTSLYQFKQEIIDYTKTSTSTYAGIRLHYDTASQIKDPNEIRIVDDTSQNTAYSILSRSKTPRLKNIPIVDRYQTDGKDIAVLDLGKDSKQTNITVSLLQKTAEGTVSVFGTDYYFGIDESPWDVLTRDAHIYKNINIGDQTSAPITYEQVSFPSSNMRYLMVVLKYNQEDTTATNTAKYISIGTISVPNPNFDSQRESFYSQANIDEKAGQTVITVDTKNYTLSHDMIQMTMYGDAFMMSAHIETSNNNNDWTDRGNDTLYKITQGKTKIEKTWLNYSPTQDRFIRITIGQTGIQVHRLMEISGEAQYIVWKYEPSKHYTLYYGSPYNQAETHEPLQMMSTTSAALFLNNDDDNELQLGIREENPNFISQAINSNSIDLSKLSLADIKTMVRERPYSMPVIASIFSLISILLVIKVLRI